MTQREILTKLFINYDWFFRNNIERNFFLTNGEIIHISKMYKNKNNEILIDLYYNDIITRKKLIVHI